MRCDTSQISGEGKFSIQQGGREKAISLPMWGQVDGGQTLPSFWLAMCFPSCYCFGSGPSQAIQLLAWDSWTGQDLWPLGACPRACLLTECDYSLPSSLAQIVPFCMQCYGFAAHLITSIHLTILPHRHFTGRGTEALTGDTSCPELWIGWWETSGLQTQLLPYHTVMSCLKYRNECNNYQSSM